MNNESVSFLVEKDAVVRVLSQYAQGIDRKDAELYRSCLTDPIDVDAGDFGGTGMRADDWLAEAFEIADGYTSTQHIITNHEVEFPDGPGGNEARCRAYLQAQHWRRNWEISPRFGNILGVFFVRKKSYNFHIRNVR